MIYSRTKSFLPTIILLYSLTTHSPPFQNFTDQSFYPPTPLQPPFLVLSLPARATVFEPVNQLRKSFFFSLFFDSAFSLFFLFLIYRILFCYSFLFLMNL